VAAGAAVALGLGAALAPTAGTAQAVTARDSLELRLDEALRIAEANNPGYRRSVNQLGLNGVSTRSAWAQDILPTPSLTLFNTGYTGNLTRRATDNFGNPIENPTADWSYFSNTQQSLLLTWEIQGASIFHAMDRVRVDNREREVAEARSWAETRSEVLRSYWDAVEQQALMEVETALLEARTVDLELARRLFDLAQRSRVDVLNAELAVEQQRLTLEEQRAALAQALLSLRTVLGDPDLPPLRLVDDGAPVFDPRGLDTEALVERARESAPRVREARVSLESARVGVREAGTSWWPELTARISVARRAQTQEGDALFDVSWDEDLDQQFSVGLSFPMFNDFFGNRLRQEQARVQASNQAESLRQTRLEVEEEVRGALLDLENQWERYRLARRSAEIAAEALELAREEYRLGTRTFEQLRESVEQEAETRRRLTQSRFQFLDALATLEATAGVPVGADGDAGPGSGAG
jgi:outer membrane protein